MKNKNNFIYSNNNKRYHTYDFYLNQKYGVKTAKIALNAGFSCPHINISQNGSGCIYCDSRFRLPPGKENNLLSPAEIIKQFNEKKAALAKKWKETKYIAYFQAGTNTFAPVAKLKEIYESVLNTDNINIDNNLVGIDIATRPDCITWEIVKYLSELNQNKKIDITVELGLQTFHDKTAEFINRGYKLEVFENAYKILAEYKIPVTVHIINSLPGETPEMMTETAKYIANLDPLPLGIKIHMLYVEPETELYDLYNSGKIDLLSKEEYIDIVVSQLEFLPPQIVIMRLTGDPAAARGVQNATIPSWVQKKFAVINDIDRQLEKRGTYQGKLSGYEFVGRGFPDAPQTPVSGVADNGASGVPRPTQNGAYQESLTNILSMAKRLLDVSIKENGVYADFTMGKGNDTLYIKKSCPSCKIYAFDIQKEAVEITKKRLEYENCLDDNIFLIHDSHANFKKYMPDNTELDGAIFNLGYLPGGDKSVTTKTDSTLSCLKDALDILKIGGVIVVSVYPGHDEGTKEGKKIFDFAENLDKKQFDCLYHRLINIPEAPFIIAFQKKTGK